MRGKIRKTAGGRFVVYAWSKHLRMKRRVVGGLDEALLALGQLKKLARARQRKYL